MVDAALRLTRRDGLDGLTMRALSAELEVSPMAVYHYVAGKDELVQLVVDHVAGRVTQLRLDGDGWEQPLRHHLISLWEELERYPGLGAHVIDRPLLGAGPAAIDAGVAFFEAAGFAPAEARLAWSFALTYLHGRLSVDARLRGRADAPRARGLKASDYVAYGVDAVVAGIRARQLRPRDV